MEFNLADLFESVADAIPDRDALACPDRRLTYSQLDERANRLANHLRDAGIRAGEHVGLFMRNGTEYVESMLGCFKIRAVPINVNFRYVEDELRYLVNDADLVAMIHQRAFGPRIDAIRPAAPMIRHLVSVDDGDKAAAAGSVGYEEALALASGARDFAQRSGDDRFILYTGGTTGMPKGVVWRHEDLFFVGCGGGNPTGDPIGSPDQLATNAITRTPPLVQFPIPPLIHGAAQLGVLIGLFWGDKVVLVPSFDPVHIWETVERERVTTITVVGDAMARPMAEALAAGAGRWDLTSLIYIGSAGAVLSDAVKDLLRAHLPTTIVAESFGASETGFQGMEAPGGASAATGRRFMMNDRTTVLDDDLVPIGAGSGDLGRLALRGRMPLGYYKDPEKTAATFVEVRGERWVMPGDLATVEADGTITVFGRGAVCINSGGEKIFPEEVERALKAHPDVWDAVVVGLPDERWGERVAAVVQPRSGRSLTLEGLVDHCRAHVAGYKIPREARFVERILRHPSGKPDYPWARAVARGDDPPQTGGRS